jgi:hypothetical protein
MDVLTQDPTVILLFDNQGKLLKTATNVSPELEIVVTQNPDQFADLSAGRPFRAEPSKDVNRSAWTREQSEKITL